MLRRTFLKVGVEVMLSTLLGKGAKTPVKIMPLGDSITSGYGHEGGYRIRLGALIEDATYDAVFVGSQENGPAGMRSRQHEGHDGWTIPQLAAPLNDWLQTQQPDIVLLHMGTNDLWEQFDVPATLVNLENLIRQICAQVPQALVMVAAVIRADTGVKEYDKRIRLYGDVVPGLVWNLAGEGLQVVLTDMRNLGVATEDGVHPTAAGYDLMGEQWWIIMQGG